MRERTDSLCSTSAARSCGGARRDLLRRHDDSWRIAQRRVYLNSNVLQASNLQLYF